MMKLKIFIPNFIDFEPCFLFALLYRTFYIVTLFGWYILKFNKLCKERSRTFSRSLKMYEIDVRFIAYNVRLIPHYTSYFGITFTLARSKLRSV